MRGRRDLCRLRFFGKIARLSPEKLLKQVFNLCKPITGNMPTTWCGSTRKLLFDLCLGHVWSSESVGPTKDWEKVISASLRAREVHEWKEGLQRKSKLRLYRTLKNDLRRESYLALPLESRRKLTEMRSGTHSLRIETGRWEKEPLEQRICKVCVCAARSRTSCMSCWIATPIRAYESKCSRQSWSRRSTTRA